MHALLWAVGLWAVTATVQAQSSQPWTANRVAERAVETAPSLARAEAARLVAEAAADRQFVDMFPRLELSGTYTRLNRVPQAAFTFGDALGQEVQAEVVESLLRDGIVTLSDDLQDRLNEAAADAPAPTDESESDSGNPFPQILNRYTFRASLTYPVSDAWLRIRPAYKAARQLQSVEALRARAEENQVALNAREAFYQALGAQSGLDVARSQLANVEAQLKQVEAFVEAGTLPRVDAMRLSAQRDSARVTVAQAEGGLLIAHSALRTLLHIPGAGPLQLDGSAGHPAAPQGNAEQLVQLAISRRPELKVLRASIKATGLLLDSAKAGQLPSLSIAANGDLSNPNARIIPQEEKFKPSADVSVVLSWSPNNFASARYQMRETQAQIAQAEADVVALQDAVRVEVTQRLIELQSNQAALGAAESAAGAAEESYRVRLERFKAGAAVISDVIDAEQELATAKIQQVRAQVDLRLAEARLSYAVGD